MSVPDTGRAQVYKDKLDSSCSWTPDVVFGNATSATVASGSSCLAERFQVVATKPDSPFGSAPYAVTAAAQSPALSQLT